MKKIKYEIKKHWMSFSWSGFEDLLKGKDDMKGIEIPKNAKITSIDWVRCTYCKKYNSDHAGFCNGSVTINYKKE